MSMTTTKQGLRNSAKARLLNRQYHKIRVNFLASLPTTNPSKSRLDHDQKFKMRFKTKQPMSISSLEGSRQCGPSIYPVTKRASSIKRQKTSNSTVTARVNHNVQPHSHNRIAVLLLFSRKHLHHHQRSSRLSKPKCAPSSPLHASATSIKPSTPPTPPPPLNCSSNPPTSSPNTMPGSRSKYGILGL